MSLPVLAIIGRPNVGKSTFFNRISKGRQAITDDAPGVTRDRHYNKVDWAGKYFYVIDTGGFVPNSEEIFDTKIREQAQIAIEEADSILYMVDAHVGPVDVDNQIAKLLRKSGKPIILVVNKADNEQFILNSSEFFSLGLGEPIPISSTAGRNIGNLLDEIIKILPESTDQPEEENNINVAVIGKPNVGKSSIVNKLLGESRQIVTPTPGTTRDSIDTDLDYNGQHFTLIDTAGLRRAARVKENVEFYTTLRTIRSLQRSDIAMVLVEAPEGITAQDIKIIEQAEEERKGIVVVVNKWDLVEKDTHTIDDFTKTFHERAPMMKYIPLVFVSALTGQRVTKTLDVIMEIFAERNRRLQTAELNNFLATAVSSRTPPARGGKFIKFYYVTQTEVAPPTFVFFANHPDYLDRQYIRYLENCLRDSFGFVGNALRLKFKKRS